MSRQLSYLLVADGGTDRALVPILEWAIHRLDPEVDILEPEFRKRHGSVPELLGSLETGAMLVFVHRDAETVDHSTRLQEFDGHARTDIVPVIPVRMTEAWLLIDGAAIGRAADRPDAAVSLPAVDRIEALANPKKVLEDLLLLAAGNPTGRRRKQFARSIVERRVSVASLTSDYSALEALPAFQRFQADLAACYPYSDVTSRSASGAAPA